MRVEKGMPAISIDTFFACSLMVILALSAMAGTSKMLYPYINNVADQNIQERFKEISRYILLNAGAPLSWGQNSQTMPEIFGLAKAEAQGPYELDIDKVSRLNSENLYALSYAQIFTALKMSDVSFKIEVELIFEVSISLTATFNGTDETVYQFEVLTEDQGIAVQADLKGYVIAEDYLEATNVYASNGRTSLNVTLPNTVEGPVLFVVFAKARCDNRIVSFGVYAFAHNSAEPSSKGTFLRLSPLNYVLNASFAYPETVLSDAYALTFDYNSTLTQIASGNQSAAFQIPQFHDSSPTVLIVTGQNLTTFFAEWATYPQIPLQIGADLSNLLVTSNVFVYTYIVTIDSGFYKCTFWLGSPKE
ncbi:MAG: hypothetical protein QXL71_05100 [Candidatus Bathyarchaeia archaeon]